MKAKFHLTADAFSGTVRSFRRTAGSPDRKAGGSIHTVELSATRVKENCFSLSFVAPPSCQTWRRASTGNFCRNVCRVSGGAGPTRRSEGHLQRIEGHAPGCVGKAGANGIDRGARGLDFERVAAHAEGEIL